MSLSEETSVFQMESRRGVVAMPIDVLQGQTTMHKNGKPIYYFVAEYISHEQVSYRLYPVKDYGEWLHCKNWCEKLDGTYATVYLRPTAVKMDVVKGTIKLALMDIGILKG